MRRRGGARAAVLVLLAGPAVAVGCGGHSGAPLGWSGAPHVFRYANLPRDGVLGGKVENRSGAPLVLDARRITLRDGRGAVVKGATVRFLASFAHGLYSPTQFGQVQNAFELERLGIRVRIAPRQVLPINAAWRLPPGAGQPVTLDYGGGRLPIHAGGR